MRPKPMKQVFGGRISFEKFRGSRARKACMPFLAGLIALACAACNGQAPETMQAPTSPAATKAEISKPKEIENCRHLHKVADLYDLLKQMHDNLDSTCLFDKEPRELEKIWGIKISGVSESHVVRDKRGVPIGDDFALKPHGNPVDSFYVQLLGEKERSFFYVGLTHQYCLNGCEMFADGKFPEFMKGPYSYRVSGRSSHYDPGVPLDRVMPPIEPGADLHYRTQYLWFDPDMPTGVTMRYTVNAAPSPEIKIFKFYDRKQGQPRTHE